MMIMYLLRFLCFVAIHHPLLEVAAFSVSRPTTAFTTTTTTTTTTTKPSLWNKEKNVHHPSRSSSPPGLISPHRRSVVLQVQSVVGEVLDAVGGFDTTSTNRMPSLLTTTTETADTGTGTFGNLNLGILRLDGWGNLRTTGTGNTTYVPLTGDVDDARSFAGNNFGLVASIPQNCSWDNMKDPEKWNGEGNIEFLDNIKQNVAKSLVELMDKNTNVIIANCGLFMWLHSKGIATPAMDLAMQQRQTKPGPRPIMALSTLTVLPSYLPLYGLGPAQREAIASSDSKASQAIIAIFTSDGNACRQILNSTDTLEGVNVFEHNDTDAAEKAQLGGVLVIGLNGPDVLGTGPVDGFDVVNDGTPAYYDVLNPAIEKVAVALKQLYPNVAMGIVECTEVSAYTDTIRQAIQCPVFDPIQLASVHMEPFTDHQYTQVNRTMRDAYIKLVLDRPPLTVPSMKFYIKLAHCNFKALLESELEQPILERAAARLDKIKDIFQEREDDDVSIRDRLREYASHLIASIREARQKGDGTTTAAAAGDGFSSRQLVDLQHAVTLKHLCNVATRDEIRQAFREIIREKFVDQDHKHFQRFKHFLKDARNHELRKTLHKALVKDRSGELSQK